MLEARYVDLLSYTDFLFTDKFLSSRIKQGLRLTDQPDKKEMK
jgi:hypothetical protein